MTRPLPALALLAALVTAGCGGDSKKESPPPPPPLPAIPELLAEFQTAYAAKDAGTIVALCDFPFSVEGAQLKNADELRALLQSGFDGAGDITTAEVLAPDIVTADGLATVKGTFHIVDSKNGESSAPIVVRGVYLEAQGWRATSYTSQR